MNKGMKIRLRKTIELANVQVQEKVLDLGCGKQKTLQQFLPEATYIGLDLDGGNIECNLEMGLPEEIKKKRFDVIFLNEFIEHIENFKTILLECREILSEQGRIIISTPSNNRILYGDFWNGIGEHKMHIHCFRKTNIRNLAKICGLKVTKIKGTFIRIPPIIKLWFFLPTTQTIYTEVIIYRLEPETKETKTEE